MLSAEYSNILAICVVTTAAALLAGWVVSMVRRSPFTPLQSLLYAINFIVTRVVWRAEIRGRISIAPDQGAVIVCNHRCPLDPSFIALTVPRVVHWMVAREFCDYPPFRRLLQTCGAIPVRRGTVDLGAMREAIRLVAGGELVGVFPEGRINTTEKMLLPGRPGAAMIALKARAPIIPCYIHGAPYDGTTLGCLLMPAAVRLEIGRPIDLSAYFERHDEREALDEVTKIVLCELAKLGGCPDFQPQPAGG